MLERHTTQLRAALLIGAISATASVAVADLARAQGLFDFLFGGSRQQPAPPPQPGAYPPPPAGVGRVAPAPLGPESVTGEDASTGDGRLTFYCLQRVIPSS